MADFRELGLTDAAAPLPPGASNWAGLADALELERGAGALAGGGGALECLRWLGAFDAAVPL
eukprot:6553468-Prymnesium_polylepis.1